MSNAGQILNLERIVPFANSTDKRLVISLSRPISHTFEVKAKTLTSSQCPRYNERGICAHTLAVAHQLGKLLKYTKSYKMPLANMVAPSIPNGKKLMKTLFKVSMNIKKCTNVSGCFYIVSKEFYCFYSVMYRFQFFDIPNGAAKKENEKSVARGSSTARESLQSMEIE